MERHDYRKPALFEHRFWLQILGDHSRFIRDALSPKETRLVREANQMIATFDTLLSQARKQLGENELASLTRSAYEKAFELRQLKLAIIRSHLAGKISISLTPSFVNHMVNELEEYVRILHYLLNKQVPPVSHPLHHHLIWLLDGAGHAGAIEGNLDRTEKMLKKKSEMFTKHFEDFYLKAVEMVGYLRTNLSQFPALQKFNDDVKLEMAIFQTFLEELEEMELTNTSLSILSPLMADHMFREECYYLHKLAESTNTEEPNCNPAKERIES
ncbi:hypothetical protein DCC39_07290 [Pueribacillus theae]|uniref:DUF2935 domain-containing protein n=1 Tax=Pueribacillus theae TaxID=2171751 RepID=A0A2U1K3X0_9BACI|nr:DUF2935 domain-containing protein [Pueribacillus theae]PWA12227.1 hypothetical protein DCC39_07290 [Pueribacillus theae]